MFVEYDFEIGWNIYFVKYSLRYGLKCIDYDFEIGLNIYWIGKYNLRGGLKCTEYDFDILVKLCVNVLMLLFFCKMNCRAIVDHNEGKELTATFNNIEVCSYCMCC